MTWPPKTDAEKDAVQKRQQQVAADLNFIESFRPQPKAGPPLDSDEWKKQLEQKRLALQKIKEFKPWFVRDAPQA
jgi:hypothetical protein